MLSVHLEIKQGACLKKDFELNGNHPSRLSWDLSLESIFSLPSLQKQKAAFGTDQVFILVHIKLVTGALL